MKITKFNGLGNYGVYVDDFDYASPSAWKELRDINLKTLVTVVRGNNKEHFKNIFRNVPFVGQLRLPSYRYDKQGNVINQDEEKLKLNLSWALPDPLTNTFYPGWIRVSGKRDQNNKPLGIFGDTELLWHSAESGRYEFSPLVILYGNKGMLQSATGFVQFADWFEKQSQSFQSELKELKVIHGWKPHSIQPQGDDLSESIIQEAFSDHERGRIEMPLVIKSPGGIEGLHYSVSTIHGFADMSSDDSDRLMKKLEKELFVPEYCFDYWWENDKGDMILFDNTITLHNRSTREGIDMTELLRNREGFRCACDYAGLENYDPFGKQPYTDLRYNDLNINNDVHDNQTGSYLYRATLDLEKEEKIRYIKSLEPKYQKIFANKVKIMAKNKLQ